MAATERGREASGLVKRLGLVGFLVYGLVHLVIGVLVVRLALGDGGGEASTSGAMAAVGAQPFGRAVLWLVATSMGLLTLWQLLDAVAGTNGTDGRDRLRCLGRATAYGTVGGIALRFAITGSSSAEGSGAETTAATLFTVPGGRLLVAAVGVGALVMGAYNVVKGVSDRFLESIDHSGLSGGTLRVVTWAGRLGFPARGIAYGGVGVLFLVAAWQRDSGDAGGLDDALAGLRDQPFGEAVLVAVGIGFALHAVYCLAVASRARWRQH